MSKKKKTPKSGQDWRIWNMTDTRRAIPLAGKRLVFIEPRGWYDVAAEEREEVGRLFKTDAYQRLLDGGYFVLSTEAKDSDLKRQKTPDPNPELGGAVPVGETGLSTFVREEPEIKETFNLPE